MDPWKGSRYTVPKACSRDFELKKMLGAGSYGEVYNACKESDCSYAVKVIPINGGVTPDDFYEEVKISTLMGNEGVGSKVYMSWICEWKDHGGPYNLGMMFMDKLDITLFDYYLERKNKRLPIDEELLRNLFTDKVRKMVLAGYIQKDTYSSNIMLKLDPEGNIIDLFIIDWGDCISF